MQARIDTATAVTEQEMELTVNALNQITKHKQLEQYLFRGDWKLANVLCPGGGGTQRSSGKQGCWPMAVLFLTEPLENNQLYIFLTSIEGMQNELNQIVTSRVKTVPLIFSITDPDLIKKALRHCQEILSFFNNNIPMTVYQFMRKLSIPNELNDFANVWSHSPQLRCLLLEMTTITKQSNLPKDVLLLIAFLMLDNHDRANIQAYKDFYQHYNIFYTKFIGPLFIRVLIQTLDRYSQRSLSHHQQRAASLKKACEKLSLEDNKINETKKLLEYQIKLFNNIEKGNPKATEKHECPLSKKNKNGEFYNIVSKFHRKLS